MASIVIEPWSFAHSSACSPFSNCDANQVTKPRLPISHDLVTCPFQGVWFPNLSDIDYSSPAIGHLCQMRQHRLHLSLAPSLSLSVRLLLLCQVLRQMSVSLHHLLEKLRYPFVHRGAALWAHQFWWRPQPRMLPLPCSYFFAPNTAAEVTRTCVCACTKE